MDAFFGAIGFVGFLVGLILIVIGFIKKKKYHGGIIAIVSFIVFLAALIFGMAGNSEPTSTETETEKKDQSDDYKVSAGEITNKSLLISLAVRSETMVEKYDKIDNVKVDEDNITAQKLPDQKNDETGEIYKNVYYIDGQYSWKDRRYDYELAISFDENNVESSGAVLQYTSEMGVSQLNVKRSTIEQ